MWSIDNPTGESTSPFWDISLYVVNNSRIALKVIERVGTKRETAHQLDVSVFDPVAGRTRCVNPGGE